MDEKVKYWIELAEYDLETAKAMLDTKQRKHHYTICFLMHKKIL